MRPTWLSHRYQLCEPAHKVDVIDIHEYLETNEEKGINKIEKKIKGLTTYRMALDIHSYVRANDEGKIFVTDEYMQGPGRLAKLKTVADKAKEMAKEKAKKLQDEMDRAKDAEAKIKAAKDDAGKLKEDVTKLKEDVTKLKEEGKKALMPSKKKGDEDEDIEPPSAADILQYDKVSSQLFVDFYRATGNYIRNPLAALLKQISSMGKVILPVSYLVTLLIIPYTTVGKNGWGDSENVLCPVMYGTDDIGRGIFEDSVFEVRRSSSVAQHLARWAQSPVPWARAHRAPAPHRVGCYRYHRDRCRCRCRYR